MSHSRHSAPASVPSIPLPRDLRLPLDALMRIYRPLLVTAARAEGHCRRDAKAIVRQVCQAVAEGGIELSPDPEAAIRDLRHHVASLARHRTTAADPSCSATPAVLALHACKLSLA